MEGTRGMRIKLTMIASGETTSHPMNKERSYDDPNLMLPRLTFNFHTTEFAYNLLGRLFCVYDYFAKKKKNAKFKYETV